MSTNAGLGATLFFITTHVVVTQFFSNHLSYLSDPAAGSAMTSALDSRIESASQNSCPFCTPCLRCTLRTWPSVAGDRLLLRRQGRRASITPSGSRQADPVGWLVNFRCGPPLKVTCCPGLLIFWYGEPFRQPHQMDCGRDAWKGLPILSRACEDYMPITAKVRENQPGRTVTELNRNSV